MSKFQTRLMAAAVLLAPLVLTPSSDAEAPAVRPTTGAKAPDFELQSYEGKTVSLSGELKKGPVVLLVLRGYPGYQCPICTRQIGDFLSQSTKFAEANATVLMVYPGPGDNLTERAREFMKGTKLPDNFQLLLDPDYKFTNAYQLRWEAPKETAYPSTFVIAKDQTVKFEKVSMTHGGRSSAADVLKVLAP